MSDDTAGTGILSISPPARPHDSSAADAARGTSLLSSFSISPRVAAAPSSRVTVEMLTDETDEDLLDAGSNSRAAATSPCKSAYATWLRSSQLAYARNAVRIPYDQRIAVIPLDDDDLPLFDQAVLVRGRDLSLQGLSIVHGQPQFHRSFWIAFVEELADQIVWRAEMKWCRFTRQGHYVSGGKLLHIVPTDPDLLADWESFPAG